MYQRGYYQRRSRNRRVGRSGYFMPFLLIVVFGIIAVLGFKLYNVFFEQEPKSGAYLHLIQGSAQMRTWGTEDFFKINSDTLIVQGDEVRTSSNAKVIFEFFDGTLMRADENTELVFEMMDDEKSRPEIKILLIDGRVWFNKKINDTGSTQIRIRMDNVEVISDKQSVFGIDNIQTEVVFVVNGESLNIDVLSSDDEKVVDNLILGIGQQISFSEKVLERFWKFQSPSVIAALSDGIEESSWYKWNKKEDQNPTVLVKVDDQKDGDLVLSPPELKEQESENLANDEIILPENQENLEDVENDENMAVISSPEIISVAGATLNADGFYELSSRVATIKGRVKNATQIMVNDYILQKFKPNDPEWVYFANADFDLMKEGENIYNVYALDAEGNKSEPLTVKVFYKPVPNSQIPASNDDPVAESSADFVDEN